MTTPTRVKCKICKTTRTRYQDGICENCRVHPIVSNPEPISNEPISNEPVLTPVSTTNTITDGSFKPVGFNGGRNMNIFKNIWFAILVLIFGIAGLIFSIVTLPFFLGSWAVTTMVGAIAMIIGGGLGILKEIVLNEKFQKAAKASYKSLVWIGFTLFVLPILIGLLTVLAMNFNERFYSTKTTPTETTGSIVIPTETVAPAIPSETTAPASVGIDQPSKSWFLAKAGTLISGDVAIFDNDNNSQKTPVYDSAESTADIIYLTQDTYIWTEWGCHVIENATAQDVANIVNDKLTNGGFTEVRFFNGFNKLGGNTPNIITEKVTATSITLTPIA